MLLLSAIVIVLFLAYANGANDNFKGVATLYGSGTAVFKDALKWSTLTTALGSVAALFLAHGLVAAFSGKGLVPDVVAATQSYSLAVVLGAAGTVMLATRFGFPISTTHALTGGLVGAGLIASPSGVDWSKLGTTYFMPLLMSPVIALGLSAAAYPLLRLTRKHVGVERNTCVCVGTRQVGLAPAGVGNAEVMAMYSREIEILTSNGGKAACIQRYSGDVAGVEAGPVIDKLHYLSSGAVCFARALNDTPKIAAVLLVGSTVSPSVGIALVAVFMVIGGLINSRRVAETMAHKVTAMNPGQGLTANLVTAGLVIVASKFGMPVSTTHVSCGSLFGIGAVTRQANPSTIASILMSWVVTLPVAAGISVAAFVVLRQWV